MVHLPNVRLGSRARRAWDASSLVSAEGHREGICRSPFSSPPRRFQTGFRLGLLEPGKGGRELLGPAVTVLKGKRLKVGPALDGAAGLILPVALAVEPVLSPGGIVGDLEAAPDAEAGHHEYVVVAHLVAEADVHLEGLHEAGELLRCGLRAGLLD